MTFEAIAPVSESLTAPTPRRPPPGGAAPDPGGQLDALLTQRFGIERMHPWQREAIDALLGPGGRVLLVAPTGGGKSLCYQLPAVALHGTALVLSPLISLMEDQVRALEARGVPATFFASVLSREENARRMARLQRGEYKIVYAAPERLALDGFVDALAACDLSLVAVDEAHCIVQWGHDFRPDYLRIGEALDRLRPRRVIACTATATPDARDEIVRRLGWSDRAPALILRGFARPNLHLAVREVGGPKDALAETAAALAAALRSPRTPAGAGIVYVATRRMAEQMAEKLRAKGWEAAAYHAGLDADERARVSADFAGRKLPVVVATNAFGMGIDRPDVRVVVHAQPPSSIEGYYQEVGRAGRDGGPSDGLLLLAGIDIALRRRLCELGPDGGVADEADIARAWGQFRALLRYVDASTCRHDFILRHFGDEEESLGGCGHCDVCLDVDRREASDPAAIAADLDAVRRALAGVARAKGAAGMQAIAAMLAGQHTERVDRTGLDRLSTFGVLAQKGADECMVILRVLLANGWIDLTPGEYPVPLITPAGWKVMRGDVEPRVRLPGPRVRRAPDSGGRARESRGDAKKPSLDEAVAAGMDRDLYEALRAHRAAVAKEKAVPAYVIATDRTLMEIARAQPQSTHDLYAIHGMGPSRIAAHGEGLLEVVRAHVNGKRDA